MLRNRVETRKIEMDKKFTQKELEDIKQTFIELQNKKEPLTMEELAAMLLDQANEVSLLSVDEMKNFLVPGEPGYGTRRFEEVAIILGLKMEIMQLKRALFEFMDIKEKTR
jgi:hypothetical protein